MSIANAVVAHARWLETLIVATHDRDVHAARIEMAWRAAARARDEERTYAVTIPKITAQRGAWLPPLEERREPFGLDRGVTS